MSLGESIGVKMARCAPPTPDCVYFDELVMFRVSLFYEPIERTSHCKVCGHVTISFESGAAVKWC